MQHYIQGGERRREERVKRRTPKQRKDLKCCVSVWVFSALLRGSAASCGLRAVPNGQWTRGSLESGMCSRLMRGTVYGQDARYRFHMAVLYLVTERCGNS